VIAFIFPGQGSQKVGMGQALAEAFPEARTVFQDADAAFGEGDAASPALSSLCFEGPADRLSLTEITQPALLTTSIAACRVLESKGVRPAFVAGHSLGEYSAHVAAGTLAFADAVRILRHRGRYMQEAVPVGEGLMAAIVGTTLDVVRQACEDAAEGQVVSPANINGPQQVVIAGHASAVKRASDRAKALGARLIVPLQVSAPFHCALMKPAETRLEPELRALRVCDPKVPVVANVDASPKTEGAASIDALVRQIVSPVQWDALVRRLASDGVTTYVEVGPGTVLGGLVKKIHPEARILNFGSPDQLDAVMAACSI
jgi:[acyl-carrier-protein] S-malonyltransferase